MQKQKKPNGANKPNATSKRVGKPAPRRRPNRVQPDGPAKLVRGVARVSAAQARALENIAMAMVAPKDSPGLRAPDVTITATDVKKLYQLADTATTVTAAPSGSSDINALVGTDRLGDGQGLAIATRDPVCPLIYSMPYVSNGSDAVKLGSVVWLPQGRDTIGNEAGLDGALLYPSPGLVRALNPLTVVPPSDQAYIQPIAAVVTQPYPTSTEATLLLPDGRSYGWYGGGYFAVSAVHRAPGTGTGVNIPAGGGITVTACWSRYTGKDDDELAPFDFTIPAGTSIVVCPFPFNNGLATSPSMGWYRLLIRTIRYEAPTADYTYQNLAIRIGKRLGTVGTGTAFDFTANVGFAFAMTQHINAPLAPTAVTEYLYDSARVTAASMLVTNVTPELVRGGDVLGAAFHGTDFWDTVSVPAILGVAGDAKYGYRGPFEKGCYTWIPMMDSDSLVFRSYNGLAVDRGAVVPYGRVTYRVMRPTTQYHVVYWNAPVATFTAGSVMTARIQIRVDWHQEFVSSDQLAVKAPTPYMVDDLAMANKTLAMTPCFTENWTHLAELWSKIKSIGSSVLKAGGRAAASAAIGELVAGLPLLL